MVIAESVKYDILSLLCAIGFTAPEYMLVLCCNFSVVFSVT